MTGSKGAAAHADVAVIGAGWAGLAAAVELARAGREVLLLDAAQAPGGRARAVRFALGGTEVRVDNGQHLLIGAYRECLRLAAMVGVPQVRLSASRPDQGDAPRPAGTLLRAPLRLLATDGLDLRAAPLPAPLHLLGALASARGLSAAERLAIPRLMSALRADGWQVPPGETVDGLLARLAQPASLRRRLWTPLAVAALNTATAEACAQTFANVLRDALGTHARAADFVLPADTLSDAFPDPACRWLERHGARLAMRTAVRGLAPDGAGWRLATDRGEWRADGVVLAVPPQAAARLLAPSARSPDRRAVVSALQAYDYESLATVYLAWPGEAGVRLPRWIMLDDAAAPSAYGQWLFDRGTQHGLRIAAAVVSARGRLADVSAEALAEGIARQVAAQLGIAAPAEQRSIVEKRATFRCVPGRPRIRAAAFSRSGGMPPDDAHDAAFERLFLAGDYMWPEYPATLEAAVRSGVEAARLLAG